MNGSHFNSPERIKRLVWIACFLTPVLTIINTTSPGEKIPYPSLIFVSALTLTSVYLFFIRSRQTSQTSHLKPVRMGPRFWAMIIDIIVLNVRLFGVVIWIDLALADVIDRDITDLHASILLASFLLMNWFAFRFEKQTPGQYVMQFRVIGIKGENASFWKRLFHLPAIVFSVNEKDGVFHWDRKSNTRVVATQTLPNN